MISEKQLVLKPQDLVVAMKLAVNRDKDYVLAQLAEELAVAVSQVHGSVNRAEQARLISRSAGSIRAVRTSIREFVIHGAKYAYPGRLGVSSKGMATAIGSPLLAFHFESRPDLSPVWPDPSGDSWGPTLMPLHPSVLVASKNDEALYGVLTLLDAIRVGAARERELAIEALHERLS